MTFWRKLFGLPEKSDNYKSKLTLTEKEELIRLRESKHNFVELMKILKVAKIEIDKEHKTGDIYYVLRRSDIIETHWHDLSWILRRIKASESTFKESDN